MDVQVSTTVSPHDQIIDAMHFTCQDAFTGSRKRDIRELGDQNNLPLSIDLCQAGRTVERLPTVFPYSWISDCCFGGVRLQCRYSHEKQGYTH